MKGIKCAVLSLSKGAVMMMAMSMGMMPMGYENKQVTPIEQKQIAAGVTPILDVTTATNIIFPIACADPDDE